MIAFLKWGEVWYAPAMVWIILGAAGLATVAVVAIMIAYEKSNPPCPFCNSRKVKEAKTGYICQSCGLWFDD